jgi:hypothetical protein
VPGTEREPAEITPAPVVDLDSRRGGPGCDVLLPGGICVRRMGHLGAHLPWVEAVAQAREVSDADGAY